MTTGADQVMGVFDGAEVLASDVAEARDSPPPRQVPPAPPSIDSELAALPLNDTGNGQRLLRRFGDRILFVRDVGPYVWTGKVWDGDGGTDHARVLGQRPALGEHCHRVGDSSRPSKGPKSVMKSESHFSASA